MLSQHSPLERQSSTAILLSLGERLAEQQSSPPPPPPAPQFPGHLDSSALTAGPRSTFPGASILPSSQTDLQTYLLLGEMEKEVETAQNHRPPTPPRMSEVRLRLLEGTKPEEQPPEGPQNDVWLDAKEQAAL